MRYLIKYRHKNKKPSKISPGLRILIDEVEEDIRKNKNLSLTFSSAKDMDEYLDSL